jgi:DNA-directed RNA polymerase subunit RPC12/RpoP
MGYRCVGCGARIGWNGKGTLCYTCPCGAHIFYDEESGRWAPPASLVIAIHEKREPPHLDYLVGRSNFTSELKEKVIEELKSHGAIWMKDCKQCLADGTYQRMLDREKALALREAERILDDH